MSSRPTWHEQNLLFHYTKSAEVVASILKNGFMLFPNRRNLINRLLMMDGFESREPQQFGMVSFTELQREDAAYHREHFGDFGIAMSWGWAREHQAQRVVYLGDGPVLNTFAWLFQLGKQEIERKCPEKDKLEAFLVNRSIAVLHSQFYAKLLTLYEYMETDRNSGQVEWRIVNPLPVYHDLHDMEELRKRLLDYALKGIDTIKVRESDIEMLVCPRNKVASLRKMLPNEFEDVPIVPYARGSRLATGFRSFWRFVEANSRSRIRPVIQVEAPTPSGAPVLGKSSKIPDFFDLPSVRKINGISVYGDEVLDAAHCNLQYESHGGHSLQVDIPFSEAVTLLVYLMEMARHPDHRKLVELVAQREQIKK